MNPFSRGLLRHVDVKRISSCSLAILQDLEATIGFWLFGWKPVASINPVASMVWGVWRQTTTVGQAERRFGLAFRWSAEGFIPMMTASQTEQSQNESLGNDRKLPPGHARTNARRFVTGLNS